MVKVTDEANGEEFYLDGIEKENLDMIKPHVLKDWDMLLVFAGIEGGGKSTKLMQVARYLAGERFTIDHVCFSPQEFMEKIRKPGFTQPGDVLVLDESFMINSRAAMSELNREFLAILSECRQKQLFLLLAVPNFFDLDKNLALWRCRGLFYIYHDRMQRGYFKFFNYERKKKLYLLGKKFFDYDCVKPNFFGRFSKYFPLDQEEYKRRKAAAFEIRANDKKPETKHLNQRNILFKWLNELGQSHRDIAKYLDSKGEKLTHQAVTLAIKSASGKSQTHINKLNQEDVSVVGEVLD